MTVVMLLGLLPTAAFAAGRATTHDAYFYILHPGANQSATDTGSFDFAGKGSVPSSYGQATSSSPEYTYPMDVTQPPYNEKQSFNNPKVSNYETFPNITYNSKTYVYEQKATNNDQYTYSVTWYRAKVASGFNIGDLSYQPSNTLCGM